MDIIDLTIPELEPQQQQQQQLPTKTQQTLNNFGEHHSQIECPICCETMLYPCTFTCKSHQACVKCCMEISSKNIKVDTHNGFLRYKPVRCPFCRHEDNEGGQTFKLMKDYAYKMYEQLLELHGKTQTYYSCLYCDQRFTTIKNTCEHIISCGKYPIKCPLCDELVDRLNWSEHYKNKCDKIQFRMGMGAYIEQDEEEKSGARNFSAMTDEHRQFFLSNIATIEEATIAIENYGANADRRYLDLVRMLPNPMPVDNDELLNARLIYNSTSQWGEYIPAQPSFAPNTRRIIRASIPRFGDFDPNYLSNLD